MANLISRRAFLRLFLQENDMNIDAMLLVAIVIGTLLSSASVAQARRCYCNDDDWILGKGHRTGCQEYDVGRKRGIFGNWFRMQSMWNVGSLSCLSCPDYKRGAQWSKTCHDKAHGRPSGQQCVFEQRKRFMNMMNQCNDKSSNSSDSH